MRRLLDRTESLVAAVLGFWWALTGVDLLVSTEQSFVSPVHGYLFAVLPRAAWGVLFLTAGLLALLWRSVLAVAYLTAVIAFWAALILEAVFTKDVHWGAANSALASITLLVLAGGRGTIPRVRGA